MGTIQDHILEVTVVGCTRLRDREWITKQDPFVVLQYGANSFHTRVCRGGHTSPYFNEKFKITLIDGIRELGVEVWNKRTLTADDFIGRGQVRLQAAIVQGHSDSPCPLRTNGGRDAGEVQLIMHYTPLPTPPPAYHPPPAYCPPYDPPRTFISTPGRLYPDVYPRY